MEQDIDEKYSDHDGHDDPQDQPSKSSILIVRINIVRHSYSTLGSLVARQ
jgi:hypothetical protein